jgi:hypothetical protein
MPKVLLDYDTAHKFVEKNKALGFFWDGWTIVKWSPSNNGYMDPKGMFKNNKWGYSSRHELKPNGTWEISDKYANLI